MFFVVFFYIVVKIYRGTPKTTEKLVTVTHLTNEKQSTFRQSRVERSILCCCAIKNVNVNQYLER